MPSSRREPTCRQQAAAGSCVRRPSQTTPARQGALPGTQRCQSTQELVVGRHRRAEIRRNRPSWARPTPTAEPHLDPPRRERTSALTDGAQGHPPSDHRLDADGDQPTRAGHALFSPGASREILLFLRGAPCAVLPGGNRRPLTQPTNWCVRDRCRHEPTPHGKNMTQPTDRSARSTSIQSQKVGNLGFLPPRGPSIRG